MAFYEIRWKDSARKDLKRIASPEIQRILKAVEELAANPVPTGAKKMVSLESTYRIRVGSFRIVYRLVKNLLVIEVIRIGSRGSVYRNL